MELPVLAAMGWNAAGMATASERAQNAFGLLLMAATGFLIVGLWLGLQPQQNCGSAWFPDQEQAQAAQFTAAMSGWPDTWEQDCEEQWGNDGAIGGVLVGFAVACVLTGAVVRVQHPRGDVAGVASGGDEGQAPVTDAVNE